MAAIYITLYDTGYVDGWVRSADIEEANEEAPDGPVFIYCYVPLNDEQKNAPNVMEVDEYGKFIT